MKRLIVYLIVSIIGPALFFALAVPLARLTNSPDRGVSIAFTLLILLITLASLGVAIQYFYNRLVVRYFGGYRCPKCKKWLAGKVTSAQPSESDSRTRISTTVYCQCHNCQEEWSRTYQFTPLSAFND